jgi:glycine hydroxymethyltransferase
MEAAYIFLNKNSVPGDTKPMVPGGVRVGTPFMTTRGFKEKDFETVVGFVDRAVKIGLVLNAECVGKFPFPFLPLNIIVFPFPGLGISKRG